MQWQETVNAFNSDRGKGWTEKVADAFANIGHGNNFQRMIDEMEDTKVTFHMIPMYGDNTYEEFSKKLKEDFGADITRTERDDAITLSGDLDTIYKQLLNIQTLAKGMGIDDTFLNDLGNQADEAKSKLDEYQEMYSQHVLYDKIFNSEDYEKSFDEINKASEGSTICPTCSYACCAILPASLASLFVANPDFFSFTLTIYRCNLKCILIYSSTRFKCSRFYK